MQTAEIHRLPVPAFTPPPLNVAPPHCRASDIDLNGVAALIGMAGRPRRTIIDRVRHLIDVARFPLPKTPRFVDKKQIIGSAAVHAKSLWARDLVDHWFDGTLPPAEIAARNVARRTIVRAALAGHAQNLVCS